MSHDDINMDWGFNKRTLMLRIADRIGQFHEFGGSELEMVI